MTPSPRSPKDLRADLIHARARGLNYANYTLYPLLVATVLNDRSSRTNPAVAVARMIGALAGSLAKCGGCPDLAREIRKILAPAAGILPSFCYWRFTRASSLSFAPTTNIRDEACFIRILQLSETAFFGVAVLADRAMSAHGEELARLLRKMQVLLDVAQVAIANVMPLVTPEGFKAFTATTGNISAIESENYALVEAHLTSVSRERLGSWLFTRHSVAAARVKRGATLIASLQGRDFPVDSASALAKMQKTISAWKKLHIASIVKILGHESLNQEALAYLRRFAARDHVAAKIEPVKTQRRSHD